MISCFPEVVVFVGATLADISRKAGVSITTVSKVLAGKAASFGISKKTQERVWRTARELDYAPDLRARALRAKRSNQIGVVVAHFNDPWYGQVIHGMESVLVRNDFGFLINSIEEDPSKLAMRINRMRANRIEGLILVGSRLDLPGPLAQRLKDAELPVMLFNRKSQWPWVSSVTFDHRHTGAVATQHLIELGHRRIGMLLGPPTDPGNEARIAGARRAMADAGVLFDEQDLEFAEPAGGFDSCRNGYQAITRLLRRRPDLTAVLAFDDSVAVGAMRGAADMGVSIPADLSIVGVDDSFHAEFANPPLTTIRLPTEQAAEVAAGTMLEIVAADKKMSKAKNLEFTGTLVIRRSTAPPRGTGGKTQ
jgi:DNA-binding LacI/PurR family transcriptional regulator